MWNRTTVIITSARVDSPEWTPVMSRSNLPILSCAKIARWALFRGTQRSSYLSLRLSPNNLTNVLVSLKILAKSGALQYCTTGVSETHYVTAPPPTFDDLAQAIIYLILVDPQSLELQTASKIACGRNPMLAMVLEFWFPWRTSVQER